MNKIKSILIMIILVLSVLIVISPVSAATYNVYPGDDIKAIIEGANSGDTVYIHAGTYYPTGTIKVSGHPSIIGDSPFNTIIDFNTLGQGINASSQDGVTIKNITVTNSTGVGIGVDEDCIVENCIVHGCTGPGFFCDEECTFKNCIAYDIGTDGFQVDDDDCTFINCLAYFNGDDGFQDNDDCVYINCTAANNGDEGFYSMFGESKYENCISVGNTGYGFYTNGTEGPLEIIYSNAWGNGQDYYAQGPDIGSISVDPKFVDGIDTFYLSPGSPCVDKGSEQSSALGLYNGFTTRTDGIWDKGKVDMGFHYTSSRGPPTLGLPMDKILKILKGNKNN